MKTILMWYARKFRIISIQQAREWRLKFKYNLNTLSIWADSHGNFYRISEEVFNYEELSSIDYLINEIENLKLTINWKWNGNTSQISSVRVPAFVKDESREIFKKEVLSIAIGFERWLRKNKCYHLGFEGEWYANQNEQKTYTLDALFNIYYNEQTI